jgi:3-oxoacyl-[acyl-carrier-protein] synthase II
MQKRVVITGIGILACNGKGREEFWQALKKGKIGYQPVTLFDTAPFNVNMAGEIKDFDPKVYMGTKGLRTLDRSTTLLVSASKMALQDCQYTVDESNTDQTGVAIGTALGSVKSISDFDEVTLREGPQYTNPALFPNTVINSPASQVSIWNKIMGFNTTISTGFTSSMDALQYAYDFIQLERAKVILAGGVEEMCLQTFFGFHALQFLSGSKKGEPFLNCPFDKRRNGITFSEGACVLALEEYEHAKARNARMFGEILSFGYSFDPFRLNRYNPRGTGLRRAIEEALFNAGAQGRKIDYICANANSTVAADKVEAKVLQEVFGDQIKKIPVSAIKSMIGESYSVSGAFGVAASLGALNEGFIPPTINYQERDPECDLNIIANEAVPAKIKNVLVVNFGPQGSNCCMVLGKVNS